MVSAGKRIHVSLVLVVGGGGLALSQPSTFPRVRARPLS